MGTGDGDRWTALSPQSKKVRLRVFADCMFFTCLHRIGNLVLCLMAVGNYTIIFQKAVLILETDNEVKKRKERKNPSLLLTRKTLQSLTSQGNINGLQHYMKPNKAIQANNKHSTEQRGGL